jgi:hypothetical protein
MTCTCRQTKKFAYGHVHVHTDTCICIQARALVYKPVTEIYYSEVKCVTCVFCTKQTRGESFEDECEKSDSRMNSRRRLLVTLFLTLYVEYFYLFQICCFNVLLATYEDTKIHYFKKCYLTSTCMIYENSKDC